jgi:GNAT superfamily N-acetyltransferase
LHKASEQWVGVINGEIVCHTGVIQFPMRKGWKRIHRLVVLPDYQGIGIGVRFINEVSKHYKDNGWNVNLTTTTPALVHTLARGKEWLLKRKGRVKSKPSDFIKYGTGDKKKSKAYSKSASKVISSNRITYSFNFK